MKIISIALCIIGAIAVTILLAILTLYIFINIQSFTIFIGFLVIALPEIHDNSLFKRTANFCEKVTNFMLATIKIYI